MLTFDTYYHIYNHANGNENLFREKKNYHFFLKKYHQHIDPIADTIAWCLMPNHFHLLVKIKSEEVKNSTFPKFETLEKLILLEKPEDKSNFISKQFSNFFSSYTQSFNKIYKRRGSLFLKNFKRKEVNSEDYLRNLVLYIHLNPVNHGFTKTAEQWEWSSYNSFIESVGVLLIPLFGVWENCQWLHRMPFKEYETLETELT